MVKIADVPFEDLRVGDKLISCNGKHGWIGGLFPQGTPDPTGRRADYGGHILMLWYGLTWSLTYHSGLQVEYVGRAE